jgi:hypothetical protein
MPTRSIAMIDPKDPQFQETAKQEFEDESQLLANSLDVANAAGGVLDGMVTVFAEIAKGVGGAALTVVEFFAGLLGEITGA